MKEDGGPAFSRPASIAESHIEAVEQDGMSLLDYYAGEALKGCLSSPASMPRSGAPLAQTAWSIAEAMLEERKKRYGR